MLQSDLHGRIFEDLVQFVQKAHQSSPVTAQTKECLHVQEIPTAALITGKKTL